MGRLAGTAHSSVRSDLAETFYLETIDPLPDGIAPITSDSPRLASNKSNLAGSQKRVEFEISVSDRRKERSKLSYEQQSQKSVARVASLLEQQEQMSCDDNSRILSPKMIMKSEHVPDRIL